MELDISQRRALTKLWFIYGNNGSRHTDAGHKFIQRLLDSGTDQREFYRPGKELTDLVDKIIQGQEIVALPKNDDVEFWVAWEIDDEREFESGWKIVKRQSKIHILDSLHGLYCLCGSFVDMGQAGLTIHAGKQVPP